MTSNQQRQMSKHAVDFIDDARIHSLLGHKVTTPEVEAVLAKSMAKIPLSLEECAVLLNADAPEHTHMIFEAARELKRAVYGNRIVLFAPLYVGNKCVNDCTYCGFRRSNKDAIRRTLSQTEIVEQVRKLEATGHKRLILVFGEHPEYDAKFIADSVRTVYGVKEGPHGDIRRVNINAAPQTHEGYEIIKDARIGTYQIFQETYHKKTYAERHCPSSLKGNYLWRLDGLSRAMEAGCDDVGIGVLFGLYDWRFEVLGLVSHARFLQEKYNCGPHTISFPRIRPASGIALDPAHLVNDEDFKRLVAILRLSVPYTGLILTARESAELRDALLDFGVSQIDAGSRIELGGYTEMGDMNHQVQEREQFELADMRSLDEIMRQLLQTGHIPSFCTACYRLGRTGEHFMEFAIPGFIEKMCTPNALTTLQEYLIDYASPETIAVGEKLIDELLNQIPDDARRAAVKERLDTIRKTEKRDLYF